MILTSIGSQETIFGGNCDEDRRILTYKLRFNGNYLDFNCNLDHLPEDLQNEFKEWARKVNIYIKENIKIGS